MKHCPACNFTFPDFHLVCDFDGTELVSDGRHLALIKLPPRASSIRRFFRSPKTLAALAILALFFAAAFIAYQRTTSRSTRTLLAASVATPPLETPARTTNRKLKPFPPVARSPLAAKISTRPRRSSPARFVVRSRSEKRSPEKRSEHPSSQMQVAHRSAPVPSEKQPKVVAMLKSTWRVLKKPFSF
jgi:hypothetical protein